MAHSYTLTHIHIQTKLKYTHTFPHTFSHTNSHHTFSHKQIPHEHIYMYMHNHVHTLIQICTLTYTHHTHANIHTWLLPSLLEANISTVYSTQKALVAWEWKPDNVHWLFKHFQISSHSALWTAECLARANFFLQLPLSGVVQLVIPNNPFPPRQSSGKVSAINYLHYRKYRLDNQFKEPGYRGTLQRGNSEGALCRKRKSHCAPSPHPLICPLSHTISTKVRKPFTLSN